MRGIIILAFLLFSFGFICAQNLPPELSRIVVKGNQFVSELGEKMVFDPRWSPMLFLDWDFTPSRQGNFFKQKMTSY